jgi:hypothetical protein
VVPPAVVLNHVKSNDTIVAPSVSYTTTCGNGTTTTTVIAAPPAVFTLTMEHRLAEPITVPPHHLYHGPYHCERNDPGPFRHWCLNRVEPKS